MIFPIRKGEKETRMKKKLKKSLLLLYGSQIQLWILFEIVSFWI